MKKYLMFLLAELQNTLLVAASLVVTAVFLYVLKQAGLIKEYTWTNSILAYLFLDLCTYLNYRVHRIRDKNLS